MAKNKQDIKDFSLEELVLRLKSIKFEDYRARQIFEWIYQKGVRSFGQMTDLPVKLRDYLTDKFTVSSAEIIKRQISKLDGTRKYLLKLDDGETVEAVLIPAKDRQTICLSSQVGCAFGCKFCASGLLGVKRDLRCGEMLDQALGIQDDAKERITNVVMMGTGEPLANYDNMMKAITVINSPYGFGIGARKITASTVGYIPGIRRYMQEKPQFELSISLHAATDEVRSQLMPINKKYPLSELIKVCREYTKEKGRIITFEHLLIKNVNSSAKDAQALVKLLSGLSCKVNLIPFNPVPNEVTLRDYSFPNEVIQRSESSGSRRKTSKVTTFGTACRSPGISAFAFAPPSNKEVRDFQEILKKGGVNSTVRAQRGADIDAACGQLRLRHASIDDPSI